MPNNYILTSDGSFISEDALIHSSNIRYIDLDEGEMVHFKYIKRVKMLNGKWCYYYDDSYLKKEKETADAASFNSLKESVNVINAQNDRAEATERARIASLNGDHKAAEEQFNRALDAKRRENIASSKANAYSKAASKALSRYKLMSVASVPAKTIVKGLNIVSGWLFKLKKNK